MLEEEAAACLKALLQQQIKEEADARVAKIEAGMRLRMRLRMRLADPRLSSCFTHASLKL